MSSVATANLRRDFLLYSVFPSLMVDTVRAITRPVGSRHQNPTEGTFIRECIDIYMVRG